MKPSLLLLSHLCLFSLLPPLWATDSAQGTSSLTCWYDSRAALFCDWDPGRDLAEAPCQLEILSNQGFCDRGELCGRYRNGGWLSPYHFQIGHLAKMLTSLPQDFPGCLSSGEAQCDFGNKKDCELLKAEHKTGLRRCIKTFSHDSNTQCFTRSDRLAMSVHCWIGENKSIPVRIENFSPLANIKLRPPGNLHLVNITENTSNLTWSLNISSHYLNGEREYQVRYRNMSQSWEEAMNLPIEQDQMWAKFERLSPNSKYEAAVRARPSARSTYEGVWSDWSKPILWRTHADHEDQSEASWPALQAVIVSTFLFVIIGTAFLINLRTLKWSVQSSHTDKPLYDAFKTSLPVFLPRHCFYSGWFKKILKIHIPDPEKFFPPLVSLHGNDIQKWLSSPFSTSSYCVNSTIPEISVLEVMQKNDQESRFPLSKGTLTPDPPSETSVHSVSSCFTNQGYFFFHLPNSFEIEPCQVYFTYEPFTQEGSGSKDGKSHHALPSPDLCKLAEDMTVLPCNFFHCIKATQGFQNSSIMRETEGEAQQAVAISGSSEGTSPTPVLKQDEKVMDKAVSRPDEALCQQLNTDFPDPLDLHDSSTIDATEGSGKADPPADRCTPAANATSSLSQPPPLRQRQDEDPCKTAFSSQVPNIDSYLSLKDLQSQYSHCSV